MFVIELFTFLLFICCLDEAPGLNLGLDGGSEDALEQVSEGGIDEYTEAGLEEPSDSGLEREL